MPGEVKYPTQGVKVDSHILEKDNSKNQVEVIMEEEETNLGAVKNIMLF